MLGVVHSVTSNKQWIRRVCVSSRRLSSIVPIAAEEDYARDGQFQHLLPALNPHCLSFLPGSEGLGQALYDEVHALSGYTIAQ